MAMKKLMPVSAGTGNVRQPCSLHPKSEVFFLMQRDSPGNTAPPLELEINIVFTWLGLQSVFSHEDSDLFGTPPQLSC